jgi:DNA repair photolyase
VVSILSDSVPFAPNIDLKLEEIVGGLRDISIPGNYRLVHKNLDQGICFVFSNGKNNLFVELDQTSGAGFRRSKNFRITYHFQGEDDNGVNELPVDTLGFICEWITEHDNDEVSSVELAVEQPAVREVSVDAMLGLSPNMPTDYFINPYIGCTIGCLYCNAQFRAEEVRRLDGRGGRDWGRWLDIKTNGPSVLRDEVRENSPGSVCFSPVITDPYLPIERKYRITRQCLEILAEAEFSALILTRSEHVLEDIPVLRRLPKVAVGVSVPTDNDSTLKQIEPRAPRFHKRLQILRELGDAGITTFAVVQPACPDDLTGFVDQIAPLISGVYIDHLHETKRVSKFFDNVKFRSVEEVTTAFEKRGIPTNLDHLASHHKSNRSR